MWYFAWILGVGLAVLLAIVNAMQYDAQRCTERDAAPGDRNARR
jgi:cyd operon protein YbgT